MTRMKLGAMILAAAAGATALGVAAEAETPPYQKTVKSGAPKTHIIMDAPPGAFEIERKVVAAVESLYGPGAVMSNGRRLPPDIEAGIAPGRPLPSGAPVKELPSKLVERLPAGHDWKGVGEHIIALGPDGRIETVVYDALP